MFQGMFRSFHSKTWSLWIFDGFGFGWLGAAIDTQLTREGEPCSDSLQVGDILVSHPQLFHGDCRCGVLRSFVELLEFLGSELIISRFDGLVRY